MLVARLVGPSGEVVAIERDPRSVNRARTRAAEAGLHNVKLVETAARIASAFLVQPSAMGRRLTRAKTKIRDAGIPFEVPEAKELPPRLNAVLEAIYAAYGSGWDDVAGADPRRKGRLWKPLTWAGCS
jgi:predicted RNA polymerase sigma factor